MCSMTPAESELLMTELVDGAIAVATQVISHKPFSFDNNDQQEAARLLNNPWIADNINAKKRYQEHTPSYPILPTYLEYLKRQLSAPNGSNIIIERLAKAQHVLIGE